MYLAIDIGGTKTLVAVFNEKREKVEESRFETKQIYEQFIKDLNSSIVKLSTKKFKAACVAIPGKVDRVGGMALIFGNLPWHNAPIVEDLSKNLGEVPIFIDNDANLAGLSEAINVRRKYNKVLYVTFSTGIGTGYIVNCKIDPDLADSEGGHMQFWYEGKLQDWEHFASGKAIVARYGKRAADIDASDKKIWSEIASRFAVGLVNLSAVLVPDAIIIGGGVGSHFDKFIEPLQDYFNQELPKMIDRPTILPAQHAEEAVIYGCYEHAKANLA